MTIRDKQLIKIIRKSKTFIVAFVCFLVISGCIHLSPEKDILQAPDTIILDTISNLEISYNNCGPITLYIVLKFWSKETSLREIEKKIRLDDKRGTLPMDMLLFARGKGLSATIESGTFHDLIESIDNGIPPILMIESGPSITTETFWPQKELPLRTHYIVLFGYNSRKKVFIFNGPNQQKILSYKELEKLWHYTDHALILIFPNK